MKKLKTVFISYECAPFLKKGGLGDVALGLPKALLKLGVDCRVMMPKYKQIKSKQHKLKLIKQNIPVKLASKTDYFNLYAAKLPNSKAPIYFIDHRFFQLEKLFGYKNDKMRFFFFSKLALAAIKAINFQADILHCNDWHTGMIPLMRKKLSATDIFYKKIKTIYTIHNLGYQGKSDLKTLAKFNIKKTDLLNLKRPNPMAQGIVDADLVGTVSKTYAREILSKEYGEGLEKVLQQRKKQGKLFGIVNGLDYEVFNPKTDKLIKQQYNLKSINKKNINKAELQKIFNLEINPDIPVIGLISRLTKQKGLELILQILKQSKKINFQFVLLGTGNKKYEQGFTKLAKKFPGQVGVKIMFSADLAQDIYAGSDMFLMPSRYEPCGLGQLIAMRYGTAPIVRETGGLKDTVVDYGSSSKNATGFVFKNYKAGALAKAMARAVEVYDDKKAWSGLVRNCMLRDFSWEYSAEEYLKIYKKI